MYFVIGYLYYSFHQSLSLLCQLKSDLMYKFFRTLAKCNVHKYTLRPSICIYQHFRSIQNNNATLQVVNERLQKLRLDLKK